VRARVLRKLEVGELRRKLKAPKDVKVVEKLRRYRIFG
jgi:hypothetical protein